MSLALALVAAASGAGSWCALVGVTGLGAVAAQDIGVDLTRLAVVPRPGAAWAEVVATLVGGVDLVVLRPLPTPSVHGPPGWWRGSESAGPCCGVRGGSGWPEHPDIAPERRRPALGRCRYRATVTSGGAR